MGPQKCPLDGGEFYCVLYRECPLLQVPLSLVMCCLPTQLLDQVSGTLGDLLREVNMVDSLENNVVGSHWVSTRERRTGEKMRRRLHGNQLGSMQNSKFNLYVYTHALGKFHYSRTCIFIAWVFVKYLLVNIITGRRIDTCMSV